jgi:hypothetical protein
MDFKGTKGNFKEDLGIDLLGNDDELMQIIIFSKEVNTHNVAHVFGLSQEEVMANAKLFSNSKKMLELLQRFISENMLSVYGEELAEDLIECILE